MIGKFTSEIYKIDAKGGWTYVVWPESAVVFGTRGAVKVSGSFDGEAFESSFMPLGTGVHMLPVKASVLKTINKKVGDKLEVIILDLRQ